ncbi:hypothetical protein V8G54_029218 [Vigna mungo]|uniref:Uncharacterized protein n=1 Tax=Vigna mungo TaxID=3915 RepID=A0AAQ3MTH5_VIGMU
MVVGFGGSGFGQVAIAVAVSFLVRVFSAPGPALSPDNDPDDTQENGSDDAEAPAAGKVTPVTIRWRNINCCLSDKSSKSDLMLSRLRKSWKLYSNLHKMVILLYVLYISQEAQCIKNLTISSC